PMRIVASIAALDAAVLGDAVALTSFRLAGDASVSGVMIGSAARSAVKNAVQNAGLTARNPAVKPAGECEAFTIDFAAFPGASADQPPPAKATNGAFDSAAAHL